MTTWNPSDKDSGVTLSNGDLTAERSTAGYSGVRATSSKSTGKWYFEIKADVLGSSNAIGLATSSMSLTTYLGATSDGYGIGFDGSSIYLLHSGVSTGSGTPGVNDIFQIAWDADSGKLWLGKNNSWQSGSPSAGTSPSFTGVSGTYYPAASFNGGSKSTVRFDSGSQTYSAPSGFTSWDSATTVTGTLAATEAGDTLAATGTTANFGTLLATEASDTTVIGATLYSVATLSAVEDQDTCASTGTSVGTIPATIAVTETQDASSVSGQVISFSSATWDPLNKSTHITLTGNNQFAQSDDNGNWRNVWSTISHADGKWYFEFTAGGTTNIIGVGRDTDLPLDGTDNTGYVGSVAGTWGYFPGFIFPNGGAAVPVAAYGAGDIISIALDMDAGNVKFYKNGTQVGTTYTGLTGDYNVVLGQHSASQVDYGNFGGGSFVYGTPFLALGYQPWEGESINGTMAATESQDTTFWTASAPAAGPSKLVVVGDSGTMRESDAGVTWTAVSGAPGGTLNDIYQAFDGGYWVVVGNSGLLYTGEGGLNNWTSRNAGTSNHLQSIHYAGGKWVAVGNLGTITTSTDAITWTASSVGSSQFRRVFGNGSLWVACGAAGTVYTSPDAVTWTLRSTPNPTATYTGCYYGSGLWVVTGNGGRVITSPDGVTWTNRSSLDSAFTAFNVGRDGSGNWIAVGTSSGSPSTNVQFKSSNGTTWSKVTPAGVATTYNDVVYSTSLGTWAAPGTKPATLGYTPIFTSPNGTTWTQRDSGTTSTLRGISGGKGANQEIFVARLAATEAADVAALVAATVTTGTLAATEAEDTFLLNGVHNVTAVLTMALTEAQDVGDFTGTYEVRVNGSLIATEDQDTSDWTGFAANSNNPGYLLATEAQDTAAFLLNAEVASRIVRIFAVESPDIVALVGSMQIIGSLAATEAQDNLEIRDRGINNVTLKVNDAVIDHLTDDGAGLFDGGSILLYTGNAPDSVDDDPTGTLLAVITLPSPAWTAVSEHLAHKAGTWEGTVLTNGVAGWFRLSSLDLDKVIDGSCGSATDPTANLQMGTTSLVVGDPISVSAATFGFTLLDGQEAA